MLYIPIAGAILSVDSQGKLLEFFCKDLNLDYLKLYDAMHKVSRGTQINHAIAISGLLPDMYRLKALRTRQAYCFYYRIFRQNFDRMDALHNSLFYAFRRDFLPIRGMDNAYHSLVMLRSQNALFVDSKLGYKAIKSLAAMDRIAASLKNS